MPSRALAWLRRILLRRQIDREMREEMALHIECATERLVGRGLSLDEARLTARREFGNVTSIQETARSARGGRWIDATLRDARYAGRQFARMPLTTAAIVLVLAFGIGANTVVFTVVNAIIGQPPLGVPRDEALVRIRGWSLGDIRGRVPRRLSYAEVQAHAGRGEVFREVGAWTTRHSAVVDFGGIIDGSGEVRPHYVTPNYFTLLGIRPVTGGVLSAGSGGTFAPDLVAVISYRLWRDDLGGASDVVGKTIRIDDVPVTIVGVAPDRFVGIDESNPRAVWLPLGALAVIEPTNPAAGPDSVQLLGIARLRPDVSPAAAEPIARAVAGSLFAARGSSSRLIAGGRREYELERSLDVVPLRAENGRLTIRPEVPFGAATGGLVGLLVLAIACTNVSALFLGAAVARRREIAVRFALGASRPRIVRQLVTESALLALAAGVLGVLVLWGLLGVVGARIPHVDLVPQWETPAFAIAFALGTGLLFGLSPALHVTRFGVAEVLKDGAMHVAGSRSRLQRGLIVAQIALTQPLLVALGAVLFPHVQGARTAGARLSERIVRLEFGGDLDAETKRARLAGILERLEGLPGIDRAIPYWGESSVGVAAVHPTDRLHGADGSFRVRFQTAGPGYFPLTGVPIVRGRDFVPADAPTRGARPTETPVVIGSDLARELWGTADPVGRRLILPEDTTSVRVVGVVDATAAGASDDGTFVRVFVPPRGSTLTTMLLRTSGPAEWMIPMIRATAYDAAPEIPIRNLWVLSHLELSERAASLQVGAAAVACGILVLALAAIGLFAMTTFSVTQRTREIGIRVPLGASTSRVLGLFMESGLRLAALGLGLGLPVSLIVLRLLPSSFGVRPSSVAILFPLIVGVVCAVASLATWVPARRAATIHPMHALRVD